MSKDEKPIKMEAELADPAPIVDDLVVDVPAVDGLAIDDPMPESRWQPADEQTTAKLFERAVEVHSKRLLAIARAIVGTRASAEDIVQQAFMNLYIHRHRYDWREPGGLLRRTVVNEALRILRQPRLAAMADETGGPGNSPTPVAEMIENETTLHVRDAISRLPEHFRAALVLCEYENMPYAEIAQTLGATVAQVKTWIFRGRRQLEQKLGPYVREQGLVSRNAKKSRSTGK